MQKLSIKWFYYLLLLKMRVIMISREYMLSCGMLNLIKILPNGVLSKKHSDSFLPEGFDHW